MEDLERDSTGKVHLNADALKVSVVDVGVVSPVLIGAPPIYVGAYRIHAAIDRSSIVYLDGKPMYRVVYFCDVG